jgi:phage-related protein
MMTKEFEVVFYETVEGQQPVLDFIATLEIKLKAKVFRDLELLENNGNNLGMPFSKYLEDGIFELRSKQGSNITRIFYFFVVNKKIIVTNGFRKKTQKTPPGEIKLAKKYRDDFLAREQDKEGGIK